MDILTPLNIVMTFVLFALILSARTFYRYRTVLKTSLTLAMDSVVKKELGHTSSFDEVVETAKEEYIACATLWLPLLYAAILSSIVIWFGFSHGVSNFWFNVYLAGAVSAIVTRVLTHDHRPQWLFDWYTEMMTTLTDHAAGVNQKRFEEIHTRADELFAKANTEELSEEEQSEMIGLIIDAKFINDRAIHLKEAAESISYYIKQRQKESLPEDD